jgi:hypothetical protein
MMNKPVRGKAEVDAEGKKIAAEVAKKVTQTACKNYDLETAKRLRKVFAKAVVELDDSITTKIQQSIGGVIGTRRKRKGG